MPDSGERLLDRPLAGSRREVQFDPAALGMAPLDLEVLVAGEPTPVDLFLAQFNTQSRCVEMTLACSQGEEFRSIWRDRLLESAQRVVFVPLDQVSQVHVFFRECACNLLSNPEVPLRRKRLVLQEMATLNLRGVFASDLSPRAMGQAVNQAEDVLKRVLGDNDLLTNLTQVLRSDYSVYTHSVNVSLLAMALGRHLKLTEARVEALGMAGMLHDLGRAKLPKDLLQKTGELTEQEWALMRGHPYQGYSLLGKVPTVSTEVLKMVLHHHENADGSGYPHGLKAADTPMGARLLRVVDAYDAMTSNRPHREALGAFDAASAIMAQSASAFGEDIGPRFVRFLASPFMAQ